VSRADNLTTFTCRTVWISGSLNFWNSQSLSKLV